MRYLVRADVGRHRYALMCDARNRGEAIAHLRSAYPNASKCLSPLAYNLDAQRPETIPMSHWADWQTYFKDCQRAHAFW